MGVVFGSAPLPPDLPIFFNDSPKVGLGLYNHSFTIAMATDMAMLLIGLTIYIWYKMIWCKTESNKDSHQCYSVNGTVTRPKSFDQFVTQKATITVRWEG